MSEENKIPGEASACAEAVSQEDTLLDFDALQEENARLKDQLLRTVAEFENVRKRFEREKEDLVKYSVAKFAKELLTMQDTFAKALSSLPEIQPETFKAFVEGIKMTDKALTTAFEQVGIRKIEALNQPFDAHFHQAMAEVENQQVPPQTVVTVLQEGYMIHDRLLRPALVVVSRQ
jgi:molecular chaperone GrpE